VSIHSFTWLLDAGQHWKWPFNNGGKSCDSWIYVYSLPDLYEYSSNSVRLGEFTIPSSLELVVLSRSCQHIFMDPPSTWGPQTQSAMSTGSSSLVSSHPEKRSSGRRSSMSLDLSCPATPSSSYLLWPVRSPFAFPFVSSNPAKRLFLSRTSRQGSDQIHPFLLHTLLFSPLAQDQGLLSQPTVRCYSISSLLYFVLSSSQSVTSVTAHTKTSLFKPFLLLFSPLQTRHFGKGRRSTSSSLAPGHVVRLVTTTIIVIFISNNHLSPIKAPTPDFPTLP
jgi:hypothetical protein